MTLETLSRGEYTQASDIYYFGMEVLISYPPYYKVDLYLKCLNMIHLKFFLIPDNTIVEEDEENKTQEV
ncbi:hypothetical protein Glove_177g145 [Diversispora epigaea]|uniref:Uncharacterized protein n=1 Tax=Diversispora epigaea TaxID=1348612 RepID=A0A397IWT2_9GLOM|nr:hypothetical protein Glove_177g145 [Diversispora epigaea]